MNAVNAIIFEASKLLHNPLSLKQLSILSIFAQICKIKRIKELLFTCCVSLSPLRCKDPIDWQEFEAEVMAIVSHFNIPSNLKKEMSNSFGPIRSELIKWIAYHASFDVGIPDEFYWTGFGKIDWKKTAMLIVKNEKKSIAQRYIMACINCFEKDACALWKKMYPKTRRYFYFYVKANPWAAHHGLVLYWSDYMRERFNLQKKRRYHNYNYSLAFSCAVLELNKVAVEYFFHKLSSRERANEVLKNLYSLYVGGRIRLNFQAIVCENLHDIVFFLISHLNDEDKLLTFQDYPVMTLECFLYSQRQVFFLDVAKQFIPMRSFANVMVKILILYLKGNTDYNFLELYLKSWRECSEECKNFIRLHSKLGAFSLCLLIRYKFQKMKKHYRQAAKVILSCLKNVHQNYCDDKWNILRFFIVENICSEQSMDFFKENILEVRNWKEWSRSFYISKVILRDKNEINSTFKKRRLV